MGRTNHEIKAADVNPDLKAVFYPGGDGLVAVVENIVTRRKMRVGGNIIFQSPEEKALLVEYTIWHYGPQIVEGLPRVVNQQPRNVESGADAKSRKRRHRLTDMLRRRIG